MKTESRKAAVRAAVEAAIPFRTAKPMAAVQKHLLLEQEVATLRKKLAQAEAAQHKAAERALVAEKQCEAFEAQLSQLSGDLARLAQVFVTDQDLGQAKLDELHVALANRDQQLLDLACAHEHELNQLKAQIRALQASTSWRITAPMRRIMTILRR